jgi:hypothetical protein
MMQEDGTGGGLFRYLYSRFLKEAGELLGNKELIDLGQHYNQIGQKWTTIAKLIREIPKNSSNVHETSKILLEVAEDETENLSSLAEIVKDQTAKEEDTRRLRFFSNFVFCSQKLLLLRANPTTFTLSILLLVVFSAFFSKILKCSGDY